MAKDKTQAILLERMTAEERSIRVGKFNRIKKMYEDGMTMTEISLALELPLTTITNHLKVTCKNGMTKADYTVKKDQTADTADPNAVSVKQTRKQRAFLVAEKVEQIYRMAKQGYTHPQISETLDIALSTVKNRLGRYAQKKKSQLEARDKYLAEHAEEAADFAGLRTYGNTFSTKFQVEIELECYRRLRFEPGFKTGHDKAYHMERAIRLGLPEKTSKGRGFILSEWDIQRIKTWCSDPYQTWWGATSIGKTHSTAAILIAHCLSMPDRTTVNVCSTSMKMTKRRIMGKIRGILRLWNLHAKAEGREKAPYKYHQQEGKLSYVDPEEDESDDESGIFAIPIVRGAEEEAVNRIIGTHNTSVALVMDELQGIGEAVLTAWTNLSKGTEEAKFLGMGNPSTRFDSLGIASQPVDGWDTINPSMNQWKTRMGKCYYFDGLKSPGVKDPVKFPYYLTAAQIQQERDNGNEDTATWWQMIRGWMPPEGMVNTLITQTMVDRHGMTKRVQWKEPPIKLVALDESFSVQGDRCMTVTADVGLTTENKVVIQFDKNIAIPLRLTNQGELIEYYILRKIKELCDSLDVPPENFGMDITASQVGFAAIFLKEWSPKIFQCQFGGSASDRPFSDSDKRSSKDVYSNRVTELWYTFRRFALAGQIRGMSHDAIVEACDRRLVNDAMKRIRIEGKAEIKSRADYSPDIMDGHVIITAMCMERFGMQPGTNNFGDMKYSLTEEQQAQEIALIVAEDKMYSASQFEDELNEAWQNDPHFGGLL